MMKCLHFKGKKMNEIRVNATITEMNNLINSLIQRNLNFAGDLATANKMLDDAQKQIEELQKQIEELQKNTPVSPT